jgi:hypothetical protein
MARRPSWLVIALSIGGIGILIVILATAYVVPKMVHSFRQALSQEEQRSTLLASWSVPKSDATASTVFPPRLGDLDRMEALDSDTHPALPPEKTGWGATYGVGPDAVRVWIFPVTQLEKEALTSRLQAYQSASVANTGYLGTTSSMNSTSTFPSRLRVSKSNPPFTLEAWMPPNHMVIFESGQSDASLEDFGSAFFSHRTIQMIE